MSDVVKWISLRKIPFEVVPSESPHDSSGACHVCNRGLNVFAHWLFPAKLTLFQSFTGMNAQLIACFGSLTLVQAITSVGVCLQPDGCLVASCLRQHLMSVEPAMDAASLFI